MSGIFTIIARKNVLKLGRRARELMDRQSYDDALKIVEKASRIARKDLPADSHEFIRALNSLAAVNMHLGRHDVAEAVLREIVDGRAIDIESEEYAAALNNLSLSYARYIGRSKRCRT